MEGEDPQRDEPKRSGTNFNKASTFATLLLGFCILSGLWYWILYGGARALPPLRVQVEVVRDLVAGHEIAADALVVAIGRYGGNGNPIRAPRQAEGRRLAKDVLVDRPLLQGDLCPLSGCRVATSGRPDTRVIPFAVVGAAEGPEVDTALAGIVADWKRKTGDESCEILVTGHTDTSGSEAANLVLSDRRAAAVAVRLRSELPTVAIASEVWGERRLAKLTGDGIKEARNRRVDATLRCVAKSQP